MPWERLRAFRMFKGESRMGTGFQSRKATVIGLAFLVAGSGLVWAQTNSAPAAAPQPAAAKPKPNWPPEGPTPRTADGKPDLSGNWAPNAIRENVDLAGVLAAAGTPLPVLPEADKLPPKLTEPLRKMHPCSLCLHP